MKEVELLDLESRIAVLGECQVGLNGRVARLEAR